MRPLARLCGPIGWRRLHSRATDALRKIQQLNGELNAVVHTIENSAQTRLHKTDHDSDQKESNATDHGISTSGGVRNAAHDAFDGIPILVKDSIHVQGMPTVCGDAARKSHVAPEDAPLIARLRRAGAAIIGKTNVPPMCLDVQTFNQVHGTTNNPYDLSRTPGGSSGGSAAAVASGMVPLAIGSDLAGSLRVPASFCGISSFKPTARRISAAGHVPNVACMQNNLTMGALARDIETLELFMLAACTPQDPTDVWEDALPALPFTPRPDVDPRDVRVILTPALKGVETDSRMVDTIAHFGSVLSGAGVLVEQGQGPQHGRDLFRAHKLFSELCGSSNINGRGSSAVRPAKNPLAPSGAEDASPRASQLYAAELIRDKFRASLRIALTSSLRKHSVWVLPVAPVTAFKHNQAHSSSTQREAKLLINGSPQNYWTSMLAYSYQAAASGAPVATLPIGMIDHLPVGVQVIGELWRDEEVLAVCRCLQKFAPRLPLPPVWAA